MASEAITIARAELTAAASRALIEALNAELGSVYSEPGATHFHLDPAEVTGGRGAFLVVHRGDTPVGCGAVRLLDAGTAELKRMYVAPSERGRGLGRRLVAALEAEARALGVRRLVLETGVRQTAALALYRATGFAPIPLYGEYCLSPETSICLGKELRGGSAVSAPDSLDAMAAAPDHHVVLLENDEVRVLDTRLSPGATTPVHTHGWAGVLYVLSWSELVRYDRDGNVVLDSRTLASRPQAGAALWSPPLGPHRVENVGGQELRVIAVELKTRAVE